MIYKNIIEAIFLKRENRFIAKCLVDNEIVNVHVKNTGRCQELLIEGTKVYLEKSFSDKRKTPYSLITVAKDNRLINMDSQIPNKVVYENLISGKIDLKLGNLNLIKNEYKYGNSRLDIYAETDTDKILIEVKGVTLEKNNVALFPDAPTERGIKHIKELINATRIGYKTFIIFIIQMADVRYFSPNVDTHKEFAKTLKEAAENNVSILAYDCNITPNSIELSNNIPIKLI